MAGIENSPIDIKAQMALFEAHEDPMTVALGHKALMQAATLQERFDPVLFDSHYAPFERGPFTLLPTRARANWESPTGALTIERGELYLDFHLTDTGENLAQRAEEGYYLLGQAVADNPEISKILGVTYAVMARSAESRQGFNTEQIDLPAEVMALAVPLWKQASGNSNDKHFRTAHVVWQDRQAFLAAYGPSNSR